MPFNVGGQILTNTGVKLYNNKSIVRNGLVLYLDAGISNSYPGSGTTWSDLSGNAYDSTLTNGPTYSTTSGGGITFDGVNDYSLGNNSLASNITTAITIIVFAKVPNLNNRVGLVVKYQTIAPYGFAFEAGTLSGAWTRTMRFYAQGDNNINYSIDYRGNVQLSDNTTYMFTAQYEPGAAVARMYYNLTEMTGTQGNPNWQTVFNWGAGTNPYYVAGYPPSVGVYSNVIIYNAMIYNRTLSYSELIQNFNVFRKRFAI